MLSLLSLAALLFCPLAARAQYPYVFGVDFPVNDIRVLYNMPSLYDSSLQCTSACDDMDECVGFVMKYEVVSQHYIPYHCWLKSSSDTPMSTDPNRYKYSALYYKPGKFNMTKNYTVQQNVEYSGNDIATLYYVNCTNVCNVTPGCKMYVVQGNKCVLKRGIDDTITPVYIPGWEVNIAPEYYPEFLGHFRNYSTKTGIDFQGNEIASRELVNIDMCKRTCDLMAGCVMFTALPNGNGYTCTFKSGLGNGRVERASSMQFWIATANLPIPGSYPIVTPIPPRSNTRIDFSSFGASFCPVICAHMNECRGFMAETTQCIILQDARTPITLKGKAYMKP